MQKFMEHLKQQSRSTYVPIGCAEKILEQVGACSLTPPRMLHKIEEPCAPNDNDCRKIIVLRRANSLTAAAGFLLGCM